MEMKQYIKKIDFFSGEKERNFFIRLGITFLLLIIYVNKSKSNLQFYWPLIFLMTKIFSRYSETVLKEILRKKIRASVNRHFKYFDINQYISISNSNNYERINVK